MALGAYTGERRHKEERTGKRKEKNTGWKEIGKKKKMRKELVASKQATREKKKERKKERKISYPDGKPDGKALSKLPDVPEAPGW